MYNNLRDAIMMLVSETERESTGHTATAFKLQANLVDGSARVDITYKRSVTIPSFASEDRLEQMNNRVNGR